MKTYIGVKIVGAFERVRASDGARGYEVHYPDGYTSWSPKGTFEKAYRVIDAGCMTFGMAIEALKLGNRVARKGWNGKGMWLSYSPGTKALPAKSFWSEANARYAAESDSGCAEVLPCITMKTATGEILMGWLASQTDMLAEDWEIVK